MSKMSSLKISAWATFRVVSCFTTAMSVLVILHPYPLLTGTINQRKKNFS